MEQLCRKAPGWAPRHHRATAGQEILVQEPKDRSTAVLPRNSGPGKNTSEGIRSCFLSLVESKEGSTRRKAGQGVCWVGTIFQGIASENSDTENTRRAWVHRPGQHGDWDWSSTEKMCSSWQCG